MAVALGLLAFLVFLPAVWCGFIDWDDDRYVYENPLVLEGLTAEGIQRALTDVVFYNWAPLTILSYQLDATVFGVAPWGFHLTNVVVHAVSAGLLYLVLFRMTGLAGRSAAAAVLWAVHPLRVESVAWIAERKDVLSVLFLMVALLSYDSYCRKPDVRRYLAVCAAMLGSLLCKSTLVMLPVLLLLLDVWPLGRLAVPSPCPSRTRRQVLVEKLPLFAMGLLFSRITLVAQGDALVSPLSMSFLRARLPNAVTSLAWYLWKSLVPTGLHPACHHLGSDVSWAIVACSVAVILAAIGLVIAVGRRLPYLPWGLGWFLVSTLPVLGLVQAGFQSHADRFTYIPHVGLAVAAVWAGCDLAGRFQVPRLALAVASCMVVAASIAMTERQITIWGSSDRLWSHVLAVDPDNAVALGKTAFAAATRGRSDDAERLYLRSLGQVEYPWVIAGLARLYHQRGDAPQMRRYRDWAARVAPRDATVVAMLRDLPAAGPTSVRPTMDPRVQKLLAQGSIALNVGRLPAALADFQDAIKADPGCAAAHNLAGIACVGLDRQPEAARHFGTAIQIDSKNFGYRVNLARVLSVLQDWPGCLQACQEALAIKPDDPEAKTLLDRAGRKMAGER